LEKGFNAVDTPCYIIDFLFTEYKDETETAMDESMRGRPTIVRISALFVLVLSSLKRCYYGHSQAEPKCSSSRATLCRSQSATKC